MERITGVRELRDHVAQARRDGARIGFVPTMGALHEGHAQLLRRARSESDLLVASIFVNPLQFGPNEDLAQYPRDPDGDAGRAADAGTDVLFLPAESEIYPRAPRVTVHPGPLAERWEGRVRPGHFAGVLTVVLKLLNIVRPDVTVFGRKDFQQAALVRALIQDFDLPVRLIVEPTVREPDGLALSSRNRYLSPAERAEAQRIPGALDAVVEQFRQGERDVGSLLAPARAVLGAEPAIAVDYLTIVDAETLEPRECAAPGDVALVAARVGSTRLLDNAVLELS